MIEVKRVGIERKTVSEMTEREILRQQLELLAEESKRFTLEELAVVSKVMLEIAGYLSPSDCNVL